jgi:hypothetical protein
MDRLRRIITVGALLGAFGMSITAWLFCRLPGVPLWASSAPFWRAGEYLTDTGEALRIAAIPALIVGAGLIYCEARRAVHCS